MNNNLHFKAKSISFAFVIAFVLLFPLTSEAKKGHKEDISFLYQVQNNKITLKIKDATLKTILYAIQKQTKINFIFDDEVIKGFPNKSVNLSNVTVEEALRHLLADSNLSYIIRNDNITIVRKTIDLPITQGSKFTLNGKVMDKNNKPIPGATIIIKDTNKGAISNEDGQFSIANVTPGNNLVITYVGMKELTKIAEASTKEVVYVLEEDLISMDDVVVTGMFNKSKESYTGAVTIVTAKELKQYGNRNLIQSLRNIDPAFNIIENNTLGSNPNKLPEVQIRGNSSLPNVDQLKDETRVDMNTPLIILDGFESSLQKMMDMNDDEVETIAILKDASATAIYGSRGANGVIVITTKTPMMGKLKVYYRGNLNLEVPDLSAYDVLNAREKLDLERKVGLWDMQHVNTQQNYQELLNDVNAGVDTYWLSKPLRTAIGHKHNFRIEGGDNTFRYSASIQYNDIQGVMKESFRRSMNGTINLSYRYKNFKFSNNLMIDMGNTSDSPYGSFNSYVRMNPYYRTHDEQGNVIKKFTRTEGSTLRIVNNPLYNALLNTHSTTNSSDITNNLSVEWNIIEELLFRGRIGLNKMTTESDDFKPAEHTDFSQYVEADLFRRGSYKYGTGKGFSYDASLNLSYSKTFAEKHTLYAGVDYNIRQNDSSNYSLAAEGFNNEEFDFLSMALQYPVDGKPAGSESFSRAIGITGSINYMYDSRYYVDLSGRTDGSSQFGSAKRFAPFWSVGMGWNVHREKFLKDSKVVSFLKLRASTGITGSQSFSSYQATSTYKYYTDKRYYNWLGASMASLGNENLRWQQKMNYNVGAEVKFLNNRISLSGDYYTATTKDMISTVNIPYANGFGSYIENAGKMRNNGFELKVSAFLVRNLKQDISWSVTGSLIHNENRILSISEALLSAQEPIEAAAGANPNLLYKPGYSTNTIWVVKSLGIDPSSGREVYLDRNGEFTYDWDSRDLTNCGVGEPKYQGNFSTMFRYKDFSVNMSFGYRWGGQLYNSTLISNVENSDYRSNVDARVYYDRWEKPGDVVGFKSLKDTKATNKTSRFVENESTLTCQSMNIQYELKSKTLNEALKLDNLLLSFSTSDLFHISTVKRERGTSYPFSRQFSVSLSATF